MCSSFIAMSPYLGESYYNVWLNVPPMASVCVVLLKSTKNSFTIQCIWLKCCISIIYKTCSLIMEHDMTYVLCWMVLSKQLVHSCNVFFLSENSKDHSFEDWPSNQFCLHLVGDDKTVIGYEWSILTGVEWDVVGLVGVGKYRWSLVQFHNNCERAIL